MNDTTLTHSALIGEQDAEQFSLTSRMEILGVLRGLIKHADLVNVVFNHGHDSIITTLLEADHEENRLIFDWGGSEHLNERLLEAGRHIFYTSPGGVRIQFVCGEVGRIEYGGRDAFVTTLPASLVRMQRREYFRIEVPHVRPPLGILLGKDLQLPVHDISVGGVSFVLPKGKECQFETMDKLDIRVDLGEFGVVEAKVEVRNKLVITARNGAQYTRMGCHFVDLSFGLQARVQRYMTKLQREHNQFKPD